MKVLNRHKRTINQPKAEIVKLLKTLATKADMVWPHEHWPAMRFKNGLKVGSSGGHGIIRYSVETYIEDKNVRFRFSKPKGFHGFHEFRIIEVNNKSTEITHTIEMNTRGIDTIKWLLVIRWLHDALTEDALDKIENHFSKENKNTPWSLWVRFWRFIFKLLL